MILVMTTMIPNWYISLMSSFKTIIIAIIILTMLAPWDWVRGMEVLVLIPVA